MGKTKIKIYKDDTSDTTDVDLAARVSVVQIDDAPKLATWEAAKENILPISQGRKIEPLTESLPLVDSNKERQEFMRTRKEKFDNDLKETTDDLSKQLDIWYEYISWLEQHLPDGGKVHGIADVIEQCIEIYYEKNEFKQDQRLFDMFMKFRRFCDEPIEIFNFMYANSICNLMAKFYLNWSWHYEIKKNLKRAEDLIKLGLKNLATPRESLLEAEKQLNCRIERMIRAGDFGDTGNWQATSGQSATGRTFQSLKVSAKVPAKRVGSVVEKSVGGLKSLQTKRSKSNKAMNIHKDEGAPMPTISENPVPTSQSIRTVGRQGSENSAPRIALRPPSGGPTVIPRM